MGCLLLPSLLDPSKPRLLQAKYHLAGLSASSMSMRLGLWRRPSACWIMVTWSWRTNFAPKNLAMGVTKRDVVEDVPRGDDVDAAGGGGDGRDGGEAGEPLVARSGWFRAAVGQDEVDGGFDGLAVDAEQFVGRGVAAGGVGGHAEAFGDGLEALGLFADAGARSPPPGLMDEGSVGWVHEADDAVVDVAGQVGGEVGGAVAGAELG
jgi:hypothetical protein